MILTSGLKATGNIVQSTPQDFFDFLNGIFRFDLDVCALPENSKCDRFFTPDTDGLTQPWGGCMVQSSLREGHHQLGQEGERGIQETLLPLRRHAASGTDGYEVVPAVCPALRMVMVRGRSAEVRRVADIGPVPVGRGGICKTALKEKQKCQ